MEVLVLDGKKYIKASKAARDLGYTSDYVGQLCRSGQVKAHLIGRAWYVDQEELGSHRQEKKRISRVKAREQAKQSIAEHRLTINQTSKNYKNIAISYESDDGDLIPETRIVEIESENSMVPKKQKSETVSQKNIIENPGEKIIMKGDLKVVDVTDGAPDPHTTILKPTIYASEEEVEEPKKKKVAKIARNPVATLPKPKPKDFVAKLEDLEAIPETQEVSEETQLLVQDNTDGASETPSSGRTWSAWPYAIVLAILLVAVATIPTTRITTYSAESTSPISGSYSFDMHEAIELLRAEF